MTSCENPPALGCIITNRRNGIRGFQSLHVLSDGGGVIDEVSRPSVTSYIVEMRNKFVVVSTVDGVGIV